MEEEPKVYILSKSVHDFSKASTFGHLQFLTEGCIPRYKTTQMCRIFKPIIEASSPNDYIMVTGLTVAIAILCSVFVMRHKRLNILIHKPQDNSYEARILNFEDGFLRGCESIEKNLHGVYLNKKEPKKKEPSDE